MQLHNLLAAEGSAEVPEKYEQEWPFFPQVTEEERRPV